MRLSYWIASAMAVTSLSGCYYYDKAGLNQNVGYVQAAKDTCDVSSLAEERSNTTLISNDLHGRLLPYREGYREDEEESYTILAQKLKRLDGGIDASYRMAIASCNSYNACLIHSGYNENMCVDTYDAWDRSRSEFNRLAVEMKGLSDYRGWYGRSRQPETLMGLRVE